MMVFIRIDDRLIHGQVVEGWVNFLKATRILVADDRVAANALQRSIMEISVPQGLKVSIGGSRTSAARSVHRGDEGPGDPAVLESVGRPAGASSPGLALPELNIGGMHYVPGNASSSMCVAVDDADLEALRAIAARGIKVTVQTVPNQKPLPLEKLFTGHAVCM